MMKRLYPTSMSTGVRRLLSVSKSAFVRDCLEDIETYQQTGREIMKDVTESVQTYMQALKKERPGISDDGITLSLMNARCALNFLLTGTAFQPGGSLVGDAIMGGTQLQW